MLFLIYHHTIVTKTNIIRPISKKDPSIQKGILSLLDICIKRSWIHGHF